MSAPLYILAGQSNAVAMRSAFESAIARAGGIAVHHAVGGTPLAQTEPNLASNATTKQLGLDWHPDSEGELFDELLAKVPAGSNVAGVLWVQGEADALSESRALAYRENLEAFIASIREAWGAVPVVIAELASEAAHPYAGIVRAAQYAVDAIVVDADDLLFKADGRHYTRDAANEMAGRFLKALDGEGHETPTDTMTYGTTADDSLSGTVGSDLLDGRAGADWINGGLGDDTIKGRDGDDRIGGSSGDDWIMGGTGRDVIFGGSGFDTVSYADLSHRIVVRLDKEKSGGVDGDRLVGVEAVQGTAFADTIIGDAGVNVLMGEAGDDTLDGHGGDDTLWGGAGSDVFVFSTGADTVMDFRQGWDRVRVDGDVAISEIDGSALLTLGDDTMLLVGIDPGDLTADDFL